MIKNIPSGEDYFTSGKELLDFSWDVVAKLLTDLDEAEYFGVDPTEISEKYWLSARRRLTTALSITQQGIELILKGKIAEVSPYLLLNDPPAKWPSPYEGDDIDFSDFRTIDAQDLIRIYDTFGNEALPDQFVEKFHELRKKRNSIMHSVDKRIVVYVTDVIESLLFMHKALFPNESWASVRLNFLQEAPEAELGAYEYSTNRICWELSLVFDLLKPAKVKEFFNLDKKQRRYTCPHCYYEANRDAGFEHKLAVLKPKSAKSTSLFCPICNQLYPVLREDCEDDKCPGNVLSDEGVCLTCCG